MTAINVPPLQTQRQRRPLSNKQISARDRRLSAIHEAGHMVVARHLGVLAFNASIRRTENANPDTDMLWVGNIRVQTLDPFANLIVSVAGAVAEACWQGDTLDDCYDSWEDSDVMSPSDWNGTGCPPGEPSKELLEASEKVFNLLSRDTGTLWKDLLLEARRLIQRSRNFT